MPVLQPGLTVLIMIDWNSREDSNSVCILKGVDKYAEMIIIIH